MVDHVFNVVLWYTGWGRCCSKASKSANPQQSWPRRDRNRRLPRIGWYRPVLCWILSASICCPRQNIWWRLGTKDRGIFGWERQSNQEKEVPTQHGLFSCRAYLRFSVCGKIHDQHGHQYFLSQNCKRRGWWCRRNGAPFSFRIWRRRVCVLWQSGCVRWHVDDIERKHAGFCH